MLLRLVHGSWPPVTPCLEALKARLEREQLGGETISLYLYHARQFLAYLNHRQIPLERVSRQDLDSFLAQRLRSYRKRYGRSPRRLVHWRCTHTAAVHRLLRDAQGQWPPPSPGDADLRRFELHLVERGWSRKYIDLWRTHARQFLDYLNQRGIGVAALGTSDVAAYLRLAPGICQKRYRIVLSTRTSRARWLGVRCSASCVLCGGNGLLTEAPSHCLQAFGLTSNVIATSPW